MDLGRNRPNLTIGEQITVVGDLDDSEDFDAQRIIRSNGEVILDRLGSSSGGTNLGDGGDSNASSSIQPGQAQSGCHFGVISMHYDPIDE